MVSCVVNGWNNPSGAKRPPAHFRRDTHCPKGHVPSLTLVNTNTHKCNRFYKIHLNNGVFLSQTL